MDRPRVLFLCAHNAARSQMAEALLRHHADDRFEICSAGLEPTEIHPLTLRVLDEAGIDTSALAAEGLDTYMAKVSVQYAIVVCERTQAQCPRLYPFARGNAVLALRRPGCIPRDSSGAAAEVSRSSGSDRDPVARLAERAIGPELNQVEGTTKGPPTGFSRKKRDNSGTIADSCDRNSLRRNT